MKIIKKGIFRIFVIVLVMIIMVIIMDAVDYVRFVNGKSPIFTISKYENLDNGTKIYYGIGYQFIEWNTIDAEVIDKIVYNNKKEIHILVNYANMENAS